jgi:hypothetical protein
MKGRLLHWWCCSAVASYDVVVPFVGLCLCFMLCFLCTFVYVVTHTHTHTRPPASASENLLFSLEGQQCVGDVPVIHPGSATYCAAASKTDGGAAAWWDADKTSQYRRYGAGCYRFVPLTVETCGRLGRPFMDLLTDVSSRASQHSNETFPREQFVSCLLRKLSVCLCRRNAAIERAVAGCFVRMSGGFYFPGLD